MTQPRDDLYFRLCVAAGYLAGCEMFDSSCAVADAMERIYGVDAMREIEGFRRLFRLKGNRPPLGGPDRQAIDTP